MTRPDHTGWRADHRVGALAVVTVIVLIAGCSSSKTSSTVTSAGSTATTAGSTTASSAARAATTATASAPVSAAKTTTATTAASPTTAAPQPTASSVGSPVTIAPVLLPVGDAAVTLDPAKFTTTIDNPYWPMTPGTRLTYRETGEETRQVVVVVTNETKEMSNGVTARLVREIVTQEGSLVGDAMDWYAQDSAGNVWFLAEEAGEFEGGKITSHAGSFEIGVRDAQPGIAVPANPQVGMQYRHQYYKGEVEDNGEVLKVAEPVSVPAGDYEDALMTKETSSIESDLLENTYYAKGVGPVLTLDLTGNGRTELLKIDQASEESGTGPLGRPRP